MARRYTPDPANKMFLGRQGENLAREYAFDFSAWKEQYGEGEISLIAQRCGDDAPYPVAIKVEGDKAIWTVTNADTAVVGAGKCELRYTVDDVIVKSATYRTKVMPSLSGEPRPAPAPQKSWVAEVLEAKEEAVGAADAAEEYASNAERCSDQAQEAQTAAENAQKEAQTAAENAEKTAEEAAKKTAAETAEKTAEAALSELRPILNDLNAHRYDAFATEVVNGLRTFETDIGAKDLPLQEMRVRINGNVYCQQMIIRRVGKNLFDPSESAFDVGTVIQEDGTPKENDGYATLSGYLPVRANTDYVFSGRVVASKTTNFIYFYTYDRQFISRFSPERGEPAQFRTPSNCAYIKYAVAYSQISKFEENEVMLEVGTSASEFEYYNAKDYVVKLPSNSRWYEVDLLKGTCRDVYGKKGTFIPIDVRTQQGTNQFYAIHSENYWLYATAYLDPTLMYNKLKSAIVAAGAN